MLNEKKAAVEEVGEVLIVELAKESVEEELLKEEAEEELEEEQREPMLWERMAEVEEVVERALLARWTWTTVFEMSAKAAASFQSAEEVPFL